MTLYLPILIFLTIWKRWSWQVCLLQQPIWQTNSLCYGSCYSLNIPFHCQNTERLVLDSSNWIINVLFGRFLLKETDVYKVCMTCSVCLVNSTNRTVCRYQYTMSPCMPLKFTASAKQSTLCPLLNHVRCSLNSCTTLFTVISRVL